MQKIKSKFNISCFKVDLKKIFTLHYSLLAFSASRQKGFSLVELIIYISVFAVALSVGYQLLFVSSRIRNQTEARYEVQQNIRFAIEKISEQVRKASAISGAYPSNTLTLTVGANQVDFQIASGVLQMREGVGGQWQNLTTGNVTVSAIDAGSLFVKTDNPSAKSTVQIKIKIDYNDLGRPDFIFGQEMRTTISLR